MSTDRSSNPNPDAASWPHRRTPEAIACLLPALDPLSGAPKPPPLPFTAPWHYEVHFPRDPRGPGVARTTLRAVLGAHGLAELTDRAELLATELATNSVRHTQGPASVRLQWLCPVLRVSVRDVGPDLPFAVPGAGTGGGHPQVAAAVPEPAPHADGGRGLLILDAVADRWGGYAVEGEPRGAGGKTIWFELGLASGRSHVGVRSSAREENNRLSQGVAEG